MDKGTGGSAGVEVDASPEVLYDLVSDVKRMGEWSPECVRCEWLDGATGPAVGARFRGSNKHGKARWATKSVVVTAEPGRAFAFAVRHLGRDLTKWSYRFEASPTGTTVIESFEMLHSLPFYYRITDRLVMGVKDRTADLDANIAVTLSRIKAAAEAPRRSPGA